MEVRDKNQDYHISVVIPAYNTEERIGDVLDAILHQTIDPIEVIVVDDGSSDRTLEIVEEYRKKYKRLRVITQKNSGAVSATNRGIRNSSGDIICLIDSDTIIERNWIQKIIKEFDDPEVNVAAGSILTFNKSNIWAKIMGYDLEYRYWAIKSKYVNHVSTCATLYRRKVFENTGLFDANLKYGYDNDMAYQIRKAGYKIVIRKDAKTWHCWRETLGEYLKQQFNAAYGRLQVIKKHPGRVFGDEVAGVREIMQVPITYLILLNLGFSVIFKPLLWFAIFLLFLILGERTWESVSIYRKKRDILCLFMLPFVHIIRNIAWCFALVKFVEREIRIKHASESTLK